MACFWACFDRKGHSRAVLSPLLSTTYGDHALLGTRRSRTRPPPATEAPGGIFPCGGPLEICPCLIGITLSERPVREAIRTPRPIHFAAGKSVRGATNTYVVPPPICPTAPRARSSSKKRRKPHLVVTVFFPGCYWVYTYLLLGC